MKVVNIKKIKKRLLITLAVCVIFALTIVAFISPISKYLIEKYDEKYTGRQITMDLAYVNPFTGYVHFKNLKVYELNSDTLFLAVKGISANLSLSKLLFGTYEISELILNEPKGYIVQNGKHLNFIDLIEKFTSKKPADPSKEPLHFSILKVNIENGEFFYNEKITPINYSIRKVNIQSTGFHWNADTIAAKFSFLSDTGSGSITGNSTLNIKNNNYRFAAVIKKFDLKIIEQYLKDLSNFGSFSANVDADIKATGNFLDEENLNASGLIAVNDLHLGKSKTEDYAAFDKLTLAIVQLSPKNHKYIFDSIALDHPYFKYERYDHLDNLQVMFGKDGSNIAAANANPAKFNLVIEIGNYIKVLAKNFFKSSYKINRLAINDGHIRYNDFTGIEKFSTELNPLYVFADSINKNKKRVEVAFRTDIKPYGNARINISINPKDSSDFDIGYSVQKVPITIFNPYIVTYTSFPLDRGTIELNGAWHVRNGSIQSSNNVLIIDPRASNRVRNKDTKWLPVPLMFALIKERGNVIDYQIPISGDLRNPKFHLRDVVFDLVENIFVKPVTTPYRITVKNVEKEIEKSLTIKWPMRTGELLPAQEKFIQKMAEFLKDHPDAHISVQPQIYTAKEKEYILLFEAKKKYFLSTCKDKGHFFSSSDSLVVTRMSIKDSSFIRYLNQHLNKTLLFTVQDKCTQIVTTSIVNAKFNKLNLERLNAFNSYFKEKGVISQIKIYKSKDVIPYNGFSFFEINYKGEIPDDLREAYSQMNDFNDASPRKRFKKERIKIRQ